MALISVIRLVRGLGLILTLAGQTWCLPALGQRISGILQRTLPNDELWLLLTDILEVFLQQIQVILCIVPRVLPHPQSLGYEELPGVGHVPPGLASDEPSLLLLGFGGVPDGPGGSTPPAPPWPARHPSPGDHHRQAELEVEAGG